MLIIWFFLVSCVRTSTSTDRLGTGQSMRDGESLVSVDGSFELGFFSPKSSTSRYLGVWYRDASRNPTVVWVANRERPLQSTSGLLKFSDKGILQLLNDANTSIVWSSNISSSLQASNNLIAQLLDSGNLVVKYQHAMLHRTITSGTGNVLVWTSQTRNQVKNTPTELVDQCEMYAFCGSNSICYMDGNAPTCACLKAYVSKFPKQWNMSDWSSGCVRKTLLDCNNTDGFLRYRDMKLPDTSSSTYNKTMNLEECRQSCLKNCSCTAYANMDIRNGGSGCLLWFDHLIDMRMFTKGGQDLYIKVPASELAAGNGHGNMKNKNVGIIVGSVIFGLIACAGTMSMIIKKKGVARNICKKKHSWKDIDLPIFDFSVIAKATGNFASSKKLGEGGFGPVYKGILQDGREVAVKRLSKRSTQGLEELKNEVVLIAKLQHRNLVKLLGCCIQESEKILIYEFMPNKSLDQFIFDETGRKRLDWLKRFNIISGIARGLFYLHQDSILRIIHRDLKTSNILLDANFNPKISDFGLARTFLDDQVEENTNRIAGTYDYMPPEYVRGQFSMKSDVFSYGVIVLELISGKKNREFSNSENDLNLLGHAWKLWINERPLELLDEVLREWCNPTEVIRCIQVGLLCVQQRPEDRPNMLSVVLMLNGEKWLPQPKFPAFYVDCAGTPKEESLSANYVKFSVNEVSITMLDAR
ncbi:G-type lectin S-receptor-like serine/threonine-protein kinase At4g27290 isoform X3 [Arachis hypogaea]|uniref:G-type lectin S-receptor-like serine/threonine-protein kinase At4g27290 isoform X3 n=1 Tax=Arachis hypogaea TaxID=3818 RepID=UPI003B21879B